MEKRIEEFRVPLGQLNAEQRSAIRSRSAFQIQIQRGHVMLMISIISVLLGLGSVFTTLFIYKVTQQKLQEAQTALANIERERAAAEARLAAIESGLKGIDLSYVSQTIGRPAFQKAVVNLFNQVATPVVECLTTKPGETKEAFENRCKGMDLMSVLNKVILGSQTFQPGLQPLFPSYDDNRPTKSVLPADGDQTPGTVQNLDTDLWPAPGSSGKARR